MPGLVFEHARQLIERGRSRRVAVGDLNIPDPREQGFTVVKPTKDILRRCERTNGRMPAADLRFIPDFERVAKLLRRDSNVVKPIGSVESACVVDGLPELFDATHHTRRHHELPSVLIGCRALVIVRRFLPVPGDSRQSLDKSIQRDGIQVLLELGVELLAVMRDGFTHDLDGGPTLRMVFLERSEKQQADIMLADRPQGSRQPAYLLTRAFESLGTLPVGEDRQDFTNPSRGYP
jgi:hypothetical protein